MNSPIEVRSKELPNAEGNTLTLMKVTLPEVANFHPSAVELNGKWYVLADTAQGMNESASWDSMKPAV